MEDPRIISALFIFLKMAYYNVLINTLCYSGIYKFCMKCPIRILESPVTMKQWLRTRISKQSIIYRIKHQSIVVLITNNIRNNPSII
jgi:hypothetical protein